MIRNIAFYLILGKPLILWLGSLTFISLLTTILIPILNQKRIVYIPIKYHFILAKITITLAIIHGTLGLLSYL